MNDQGFVLNDLHSKIIEIIDYLSRNVEGLIGTETIAEALDWKQPVHALRWELSRLEKAGIIHRPDGWRLVDFDEPPLETAPTLQTVLNIFLDRYENADSRRSYYDCLKPLLDFLGAARPVTLVMPVELTNYMSVLQNKNYRPATVNKHVRAFKAFFNWMVNIELLHKSPARAIKRKRPSSYVSRSKAMTDEELQKILNYSRYFPLKHALILFLADTGCRACGAAGLTIDKLDLDNRLATVTEKGNKTRQVAYGEECEKALRHWLSKRTKKPGTHVFSSTEKPQTADTISQHVRRMCLMVGARSLGSHSLRHRKAHQLADAKVAPSIAAAALGHSDPVITLHHYYPADWKSAEDSLRDLVVKSIEQPDDDAKIKRVDFRKKLG